MRSKTICNKIHNFKNNFHHNKKQIIMTNSFIKYSLLGLALLLLCSVKAQEEQTLHMMDGDSIKHELTRDYYLRTYARNDDINIIFPQIVTSNFPAIRVLVSVTNNNGEPITGLGSSNFTIIENQQPVTSFSLIEQGGTTGFQPIAVALVIDVSGSMGSSGMSYAKNAAIEFVNNMSAYDRAAIVKFSSSASVVQAMTSNKTALIAAINTLSHGGLTAMYNGFYLGVQQCAPEAGTKAVIGFTDGNNNTGNITQAQVIAYANQVGTPLYSIGVGSINATPLQQMAAATGGSYYYAPSPAQIGDIYNQISQNIESQYEIVFISPNISMDGTQREVQINVSLD